MLARSVSVTVVHAGDSWQVKDHEWLADQPLSVGTQFCAWLVSSVVAYAVLALLVLIELGLQYAMQRVPLLFQMLGWMGVVVVFAAVISGAYGVAGMVGLSLWVVFSWSSTHRWQRVTARVLAAAPLVYYGVICFGWLQATVYVVCVLIAVGVVAILERVLTAARPTAAAAPGHAGDPALALVTGVALADNEPLDRIVALREAQKRAKRKGQPAGKGKNKGAGALTTFDKVKAWWREVLDQAKKK